jgi:predicted membrane protein
MSKSNPKQHIVLGTIIIGIGVLALLDKLNIFPIGQIFNFWPCVFAVIGFLKIAQSNSRSSMLIGVGFVALGILLTLRHLGFIHFEWRDWWPVILIAVGASIIFRDKNVDSSSKSFLSSDSLAGDNSYLQITALLGGNETSNNSQDFKGGEITAIMGGVELDLRNASIQSEAVLNVWATWGGVVVKVPSDWTVVNHVTAILGGIEDKTGSAPLATKRLIIKGTAIMGGLEIRN